MKKKLFTVMFVLLAMGSKSLAGDKYNFNADWLLSIGDQQAAREVRFADNGWKKVTLPHAFNEDEAFKVSIEELTDTVVWYRKHFRLPAADKGKKVFIEFEGVRQAADVYVNGKSVGFSENGVMAFGFDITPYIIYGKENVIAVRVDNNWMYRERTTNTKYQWNDRNFNANYGGIPKNVWLHVSDKLYQTLPLYSNLKTTGVYVYAEDIKVKSRTAVVTAESEVKNEYGKAKKVTYKTAIYDPSGKLVKAFEAEPVEIKAGETKTLMASAPVEGLHFWSWGYGYLYDVKTSLWIDGKKMDEVNTKTGFRKTRFGNGKVWLNDRVLMMKGYAQRTTNEWPAVGGAVPAWLSDYSNKLMTEANGNFVRWMHFTPWKQDIESCDRVGLIQAMPAGDAEKDREGRQWGQRTEVMRDAIIYNRNNPSILFYECGNESISREHMIEMKAIRDKYDPHGGRAIGSREMLDIREAEYGGEMLYINKSAHSPMWAMEYCRDEGYRKYWDNWSYPFHPDGDGSALYRSTVTNKVVKKVDYRSYNRNQDTFTTENVARWYDYWRERPGTGERVSSGGAKIIFSDSNTHHRGSENYRCSGDVDPMRIEKDPFFAHQVIWDGWVDTEHPRLHIVGHWNYTDTVVKPIYVVANTPKVQLFLNGKSLGYGKQSNHFLFTFDKVAFQPGKLEAIGYDEAGKEVCRGALQTAGKPEKIKLSLIQSPKGWKADGADLVLVQAEVVDKDGRRCPLADNTLSFKIDGPAEWRGGIAHGKDNYILSRNLPVEAGVNRVFVRSLTTAGIVKISASADGLTSDVVTVTSSPVKVTNGLSTYIPGNELPANLDKGETPLTPSYKDTKVDVRILSAEAGANQSDASNSYDDDELTEWKNNGQAKTAWITYTLDRAARVDEVCLKLTGWRKRSYPLEVYAGKQLVWKGNTDMSLGYVHLNIDNPVLASQMTIKLAGTSQEKEAFGAIVELAAPVNKELDLYKAKDGDKVNHELRIVEVEFKENLNQ